MLAWHGVHEVALIPGRCGFLPMFAIVSQKNFHAWRDEWCTPCACEARPFILSSALESSESAYTLNPKPFVGFVHLFLRIRLLQSRVHVDVKPKKGRTVSPTWYL